MPRTAWHVTFAALIEERAPSDVEVRAEVPLSSEPQRVDLLLLRRTTVRSQIDRAAKDEHDDLLGTFGSLKINSPDTILWWQEHVMQPNPTDLSKLEGYRDMLQKFLAGLAPEERLAGLGMEQILIAAPIELLRALSKEAVDALSPEIRAVVRRRLGEA